MSCIWETHQPESACCRELEAELAADKVLYRNTFGTQPSGGPLANAFNLHLKNPANTNAVLWGGKLLALWEVSHGDYASLMLFNHHACSR